MNQLSAIISTIIVAVVIKAENECLLEEEKCRCIWSDISCSKGSKDSSPFPKISSYFDSRISYTMITIINKNYQPIGAYSFVGFTIKELHLKNNRLKSVSDRAFEDLNGVSFINLENNRLTSIYFDCSLPDLVRLYLNKNELKEIRRGAFDQLTSLRELYLSHNFISTLDSGFTSLAIIDLSANILEHMLAGEWMRQLTQLTIKINSFTRLTRAMFNGFSAINTLDMSSNFISTIDLDSFDDIAITLTNLKLVNNQLDNSCLEPINKLIGLKDLDLTHNRIVTLNKNDLANLTSLISLSIKGNGLHSIHKDFFTQKFPFLTGVDFSSNNITDLSFQPPTGLLTLTLNTNTIQTNLSYQNFASLSSLSRLTMSSNSIEHIDDFAFCDLIHLDTLNLGNMKLNRLNKNTFKGLAELRYLYMSSNMITQLENQTFSELVSLIVLDLSDNNICCIQSGAFDSMRSLSYLHLKTNKLRFVDSAPLFTFNKRELVYLSMANSQIGQLKEEMFKGLQSSLLRLRLDNNKINFINRDHLLYLSKLTLLNLSNNQISSIERGSFDSLTKLQSLYLNGNNVFKKTSEYLSLSSVSYLNLDSNLVSAITSQTLTNLKMSLGVLSLRGNRLTCLTSRLFSELVNLFAVYLSNNLIEVIHYDAFDGLTELYDLDLSYNNIKQIVFGPDSKYLAFEGILNILNLDCTNSTVLDAIDFASQKSLRTLSIRGVNQSSSRVVNTVLGLSTVEGLFIPDSGLNLDSINTPFPNILNRLNIDSIGQFTWTKLTNLVTEPLSLTYLSLANLGITDIETGLSYYRELNKLDLSHNRLYSIERQNFKYNTLLQILNLSFNSIALIEESAFEVHSSLISLDLSHNRLETFNGSTLFGKNDLADLNELIVSYNLIKIFYLSVEQLQLDGEYNQDGELNQQVFVLAMANNRLDKLPDLKGEILNSVGDLDLSTNKLTRITDEYFFNMAELQRLDLSRNVIKEIKIRSFTMMPKLEELDLSCNNLSVLSPLTFDGLIRLEKLNISYNHLTNITFGLFQKLKQLSTLDLSHNLISQIEDHSFIDLESITVIYLNSNPIKRLYTSKILAGLESIKFFYLPNSLRIDQAREQVILSTSFTRLSTPVRNMSDIYLVFYESVGLINQYPSEYYNYELSDCLTIINLVKWNIQLNLNDDNNFNKFLTECQQQVNFNS